MARQSWLGLGAVALLSWGCQRAEATASAGPAASGATAPSTALAAPAVSDAAAAAKAPNLPHTLPALSAAEFSRLFRDLSEPDSYFFSDNYVSNETSYLQVERELRTLARKGGAYLGVGPEQNFTYIALTEPALAFIVDIRRGNALEHLLYKAIFTRASSRSEFLALLIGRAHRADGDPGPGASLAAVMKHAEKSKPDAATFAQIHARLVDSIRDDMAITLSAADEKTLRQTHEAFFEAGLDLRFQLHEKNGRRYPSLRELLAQKGAEGTAGGFLGSERHFRAVQALQRAHRIIPVVGDFAGEHALSQIGKELERRDLPVSVFYVSNVEQYLMEPDKWSAWTRNVDALPTNEQSLFVRCYLDQGRRHPQQLSGHRTASVVQSFDHFRWRARKRGYGSFYQLVTDGPLSADGGGD